MAKRVPCKFFAHGACLKGEHCEFAHDWKSPSNNICTFYQKGICAYGSRCRYEHVKDSHSRSTPLSSSEIPLPMNPPFVSAAVDVAPDVGPSDLAICSFAAVGDCPHFHGDLCPICERRCLHPSRPQERDEHLKNCEKRRKHLDALRCSQEIECSVCLEPVLSKPTSAERKFGILSECDHSFCISCIRNWRSSSPASGINMNSAVRACPICRRLSYFVIPSVVWYSSREEKHDIVQSYKAKLRSIDCKHFDFGNGNCPFGTSCFYRHAYPDGRVEEVVIRHVGADDGDTAIAKDIRAFGGIQSPVIQLIFRQLMEQACVGQIQLFLELIQALIP